MGTRHLICIYWKGKWFVAQYGQFDGYPEGQGVKIFNFLSVARNIENLKVGLEHHVYEPTDEELVVIQAECDAWDAEQATHTRPWERNTCGVNQLYPSLARETSAGILGIIARASQTEEDDNEEGGVEKKAKKIPVRLELEFANDGLFCEWAYVIDLDKEALEVYGGAEHKSDGHRFNGVGGEGDSVPQFLCSYGFGELFLMKSQLEFLEKVGKKLGQDEGEDGEEPLALPPDGEEENEDAKEVGNEKEDKAEGSPKDSP